MKRVFVLIASSFLCVTAYAADKAPAQKVQGGKPAEWTKEQRETMAKNHEAMAVCLRSDRPVPECHEEMMKNCKDSDSCPMKGRMGHHGMMGN